MEEDLNQPATRGELQATKKELLEKMETLATKEELAEVKQDVSVLKQDVSKLKQDVSELKKKVAQNSKRLDNLILKVTGMEYRMESLATKQELDEKFNKVVGMLDHLTGLVATILQELKVGNLQMKRMQKAHKKEKIRNDQQDTKLEDHEIRIMELEKKVA